MTITTKFDVGDTVYVFHKNKVATTEVVSIVVNQSSTTTNITYLTFLTEGGFPVYFKECDVFNTKEELINSL